MPATIRVIVVDDHVMFTDAIGLILDSADGIEFVGAAYNGEDAIELARSARPDVVLMDLDLPGMDGVGATSAIRAASPDSNVVILTGILEPSHVTKAVEAGASGFMAKTKAVEDLVGVVRRAAAGEIVLPLGNLAEIVAIVQRANTSRSASAGLLKKLTDRELGILQLLAQGYSNADIAGRLFISPLTVHSHVRNILSKLGAHSKLEAVTFAIRHGAVSVDGPESPRDKTSVPQAN